MRAFGVIAAGIVVGVVCAAGTMGGSAHAVESLSPSPGVTPSPIGSGGSLAPVLPPEGLPTAPPPDAIKPVVPQARIDDAPGLEPATADRSRGGS
jgi:hypothetical protein